MLIGITLLGLLVINVNNIHTRVQIDISKKLMYII